LKQAIVVRTDLKMGKGKLATQVAHASLLAAEIVRKRNERKFTGWMLKGGKKVVLKVRSLEELMEVKREAEKRGLAVALVEDAGLTQLEPGTVTCLGIGPESEEAVDGVTSHLKLL